MPLGARGHALPVLLRRVRACGQGPAARRGTLSARKAFSTRGHALFSRRHTSGAFPSPTRAFSPVRLAPWDGEVGRSHRRPEPDPSGGAA
jgi:hypothetical protein